MCIRELLTWFGERLDRTADDAVEILLLAVAADRDAASEEGQVEQERKHHSETWWEKIYRLVCFLSIGIYYFQQTLA